MRSLERSLRLRFITASRHLHSRLLRMNNGKRRKRRRMNSSSAEFEQDLRDLADAGLRSFPIGHARYTFNGINYVITLDGYEDILRGKTC
ncbi:hypothetical protein IEQ34_013454 [Dendrobium chrysotoxum]|uniref:Uncharacterized protein n=1 Tax=Dendrobium chrysotoxum TaxID=161865 RepID=A0AAV7GQY5_DENCH|nr:hypothetical protein IEQ34_013454 [Dendrobium chrysotoxum]